MKSKFGFTVLVLLGLGGLTTTGVLSAQESKADDKQPILAAPELFKPLTEPPCSYCVNQNLKGLIKPEDVVLSWIRGAHNGGAFPLRHFIAGPRVINDTYGLFFYDPDGGYLASFEKDYGYQFHGWRNGVMVVKGKDGTLWSALTGKAITGPQTGKKLKRVPSLLTQWQHWLMLHPESTAYDLFDGKKYKETKLPTRLHPLAKKSMTARKFDSRLKPESQVMGIEGKSETVAVELHVSKARDVRQVKVDGNEVVVFWYGRTKSAVAFDAKVDGKVLHFYPDEISPETAPFKDRETGTRWTLAGRGIDGPLRGKELTWVDSVPCKWYAWSNEYPKTTLVRLNKESK